MAEEPVWFHLGVVAPYRFDAPDLGRRLWRRLYPMLGARITRKERIGFLAVGHEPVTLAVHELVRGRAMHLATLGPIPHRRWAVRHRSSCALVAASVEAVAVVHADPLDRDMRDVLWWCDWLGVPWRAVRLEADTESK
jgi:hypothetical protein